MASPPLKRAALVRLPHRAAGERALSAEAVLGVRVPGASTGWSPMSLEAMPKVRSVVLLLDARDVTLMTPKLPPLSGRRLAQAIPNLIEDLLLTDPQNCALAAGPAAGDGARLVAVTDRQWLAFVVGVFERRGLRVDAVWPAQLALPFAQGRWSAEAAGDCLVLRTGALSGLGWALPEDPTEAEAAFTAALEAGLSAAERPSTVDAQLPSGPLRDAFSRAASGLGLGFAPASDVQPDASPVDVLEGLGSAARTRWASRIDWRSWRIPSALAAACLAAFLVGLNLDWAAMTRERAALRARMEASFRAAFPAAQVVVDPVLQMQRQLSELRLGAGRSGPSDFLPLLTRFADALGEGGVDALAGLEYRDGRLSVRPKAGALDDPMRREALRAACRQRGLVVEFQGEGVSAQVIVRAQS